jgi:small subunit ribosomal protein S8
MVFTYAGAASARLQETLALKNISDNMDVLADVLNKIKVSESRGNYECTVTSTKLVRSVLESMKKHGYISDYTEFKDGKFKSIKILLSKKINDIGIIKPRYAISAREYQKYETRFIPSKDFGIIIVSTPKGIMTNREARELHTGGRLIAYMY